MHIRSTSLVKKDLHCSLLLITDELNIYDKMSVIITWQAKTSWIVDFETCFAVAASTLPSVPSF